MATLPPATAPAATRQLDDARHRFIQAWGDMASAWGISKTMAQIYALLYASSRPLDTDVIMAELNISRGNANMNLHKLLDWRLVYKTDAPDPDSRKDHFAAEKDVWQLTARIIRERNDKEIQPVSRLLGDIAASLNRDDEGSARTLSAEEAAFQRNLAQMSHFMQLFDTVVSLMLPLLEHKNLRQVETLIKLLRTDAPRHS